MLSGGGLCVGLITRPEESYRVGVSECDRESSIMRRPWPTGGGVLGHVKKKKINFFPKDADVHTYKVIHLNLFTRGRTIASNRIQEFHKITRKITNTSNIQNTRIFQT